MILEILEKISIKVFWEIEELIFINIIKESLKNYNICINLCLIIIKMFIYILKGYVS